MKKQFVLVSALLVSLVAPTLSQAATVTANPNCQLSGGYCTADVDVYQHDDATIAISGFDKNKSYVCQFAGSYDVQVSSITPGPTDKLNYNPWPFQRGQAGDKLIINNVDYLGAVYINLHNNRGPFPISHNVSVSCSPA